VGRSDSGPRVVVDKREIPRDTESTDTRHPMQPGDYVMVQVTGATSQVLKATALYHTTLAAVNRLRPSGYQPLAYTSQS
jgi:hypothetical protein